MTPHLARRAAALGILALLIGLGWHFWLTRGAPPDGSIRASGVIEATEVIVSPKIAGRIVDLAVDEGSAVSRGQVIARLDTAELQAQVGQARAAEATARARLASALHGSRPEQIAQARALVAAADAGVSGARSALLNARKGFRNVTDLKAQLDAAQARFDALSATYRQSTEALSLVKAGPRIQQVDQARAAVGQAQVALAKAESDLTRAQALSKEGAIAAQQVDAAQAARDGAQTELEQARAHLADLQAGARSQELGQAQMAVSQTKANLEGARMGLLTARQAYRDRLTAKGQYDAAIAGLANARAQAKGARDQLALLVAGTRVEDIQAARAQVDQAVSATTYAQAQLANSVIPAWVDGVVKTKAAELGEVVTPGAPIVTLADLQHVWLRVYVPENQYGRLKIGQPATVTADSFPGRRFAGTVTEIASEAEFTPKNVQTEQERAKLVFAVKVTLQNRDAALKPGMPADAVLRPGP